MFSSLDVDMLALKATLIHNPGRAARGLRRSESFEIWCCIQIFMENEKWQRAVCRASFKRARLFWRPSCSCFWVPVCGGGGSTVSPSYSLNGSLRFSLRIFDETNSFIARCYQNNKYKHILFKAWYCHLAGGATLQKYYIWALWIAPILMAFCA